MNKNKINFRLVNFTILILAIFLIYSVKGLWMGAIDKILAILFPFLISFAIAYALYPFLKKLMEKGLPKWLSVLIVSLLSFGLFIFSRIITHLLYLFLCIRLRTISSKNSFFPTLLIISKASSDIDCTSALAFSIPYKVTYVVLLFFSSENTGLPSS